MLKREENPHERLKQKLSELEQEWTAMKICKSSSEVVSWITVEKALGFVDNSPRKLMLSLQQDHEDYSEVDTSFRRKLFHDGSESDDDGFDEKKATSFCHSSCWSSNVKRVRDGKMKKKKRGSVVVSVIVVMLLLLVLVALFNDLDYFSVNRTHIDTLVPT